MARAKLIMLPFRLLPSRSVGRLNSPFRSKFSIQSSQLSTNVTCRKPFANLFLRYLTSTTDRSQANSRVTLREEIAKSVVHLQCESSAEGGICDVYLVGTCHVSQESFQEVKAVMRYLKPQAVFLELCKSRVELLTKQNLEVPSVPTKAEMFAVWMINNMNPFTILDTWCQNKTARDLKVHPGMEFRIAYEEARSYGARVYLGDRPNHITESRLSNEVTTWRMIKSLYHILFKSDLFKYSTANIAKKAEGLEDAYAQQLMMKEMTQGDELEVILEEMSKAFPAIMEILVTERDKYMAQALWRVARKHSSVVAIVGKAHLSGIERNWMQPVEVQSLLEVPSERNGFGISKIFAPVGALLEKISILEEKEDTILADLEKIGVEIVEVLQDEN